MTRVVFIEDRYLALEAMKSAVDWCSRGIEPLGYFTSCDAALPFIMENRPDVVVTDIVMHGMDGLALSAFLHDADMDVKVIIVSAYSRFEYAQRALQAGVFDYFEKPLDFEALSKNILRAGKATEQARRMRGFILNHGDFYKERFFIRLLTGKIENPTSIQQEAEFLHLDNLGGMLCVVFLLHEKGTSSSGTMGRELKHLLLREYLEENFGTEALIGPYALRGDEATFVFLHREQEDGTKLVTELTELTQTFADKQRLVLHTGIGSWTEQMENLNASYDDACRALDACFAFDESCVLPVDDLPQENGALWLALNRFESQLIRAISLQDTVALQNAMERFRKEARCKYWQSDTLKVMLKSIVYKIESMCPAEPVLDVSVPEAIDRANGLEPMLELLSGYSKTVCHVLRNDLERQNRRISEQARAYIDENFHRDMLSLNDVATQVNISPNYLSSIFKREFGQGVHEYLTQCRIDKAKELIIRTDQTVGAIGASVGYPNPYHFSMNFKKYTHLTPTEYRKKNRS